MCQHGHPCTIVWSDPTSDLAALSGQALVEHTHASANGGEKEIAGELAPLLDRILDLAQAAADEQSVRVSPVVVALEECCMLLEDTRQDLLRQLQNGPQDPALKGREPPRHKSIEKIRGERRGRGRGGRGRRRRKRERARARERDVSSRSKSF